MIAENKEIFVKEEADLIQEAVAKISIIIQNCAVMGANDSEIPTLMNLIKEVEAKTISPDEAVAKAQQIIGSKQDYH